MMGERHFTILRSEIQGYLDELEDIVDDCHAFKQLHVGHEASATDMRVYGSFLHDFYTCIERVFAKIAVEVDGELPVGGSWHVSLLERMNIAIDKVRVRVIDDDLLDKLRDFLGFRHVFRSVYESKLKQDKIDPLLERVNETKESFVHQVKAFLAFLASLP